MNSSVYRHMEIRSISHVKYRNRLKSGFTKSPSQHSPLIHSTFIGQVCQDRYTTEVLPRQFLDLTCEIHHYSGFNLFIHVLKSFISMPYRLPFFSSPELLFFTIPHRLPWHVIRNWFNDFTVSYKTFLAPEFSIQHNLKPLFTNIFTSANT